MGSLLTALRNGAGAAALLALTVLLLQLGVAVEQGQRLADELAYDLYAQNLSALHTQAAARAALASVAGEVRGARLDLRDTQIAAVKAMREDFRDAAAQLAGYTISGFATVNAQLSEGQARLERRAAWHLERLNNSIDAVAGPTGQLASQLSDAASLSLDCDHNADCLHNRYVGTARAVENFADTWAAAAPRQAEAVTGVLGDAQQITSAVKKSWWARFINLFH